MKVEVDVRSYLLVFMVSVTYSITEEEEEEEDGVIRTQELCESRGGRPY